MSIIRNLTASAIELDDLGGITIPASGDYDLTEESQNDIANSLDLSSGIASGDIIFLDNAGNQLSQQESLNIQDNISATQPAITVQENGVNIAGTPHNVLNFTGNGISVVNTGDGVVDIDAFSGLGFTVIDGEQILTLIDTSRSNKILSVEKMNYMLVEDRVTAGTYLDIGYLTNSDGGYVMPLNATIVGISLHVTDGNNTTIQYDLYVNGSLNTSNLISASTNGENKIQNNNLNIDLSSNDKIAMRGNRTSGSSTHRNVCVMLYVRWRG